MPEAQPSSPMPFVSKSPAEDVNPIHLIAAVAHETNRAYCRQLGDDSQPSWREAPDWQRTSALDGVRFHLSDPDASPEASHENWLREKIADGWVYGSVKDPAKRHHPCCVPYAELPLEQRLKDSLFTSVVNALRPLARSPA